MPRIYSETPEYNKYNKYNISYAIVEKNMVVAIVKNIILEFIEKYKELQKIDKFLKTKYLFNIY